MIGQRSKITAKIDCPVCFSNNSFYIEQTSLPLICEDCGFVLADLSEQICLDNCIFCGNDKFYFQSPSILKAFSSLLICYVCDAEYKGLEPNESDEKFDEKIADELRLSNSAINLRERIELYNRS